MDVERQFALLKEQLGELYFDSGTDFVQRFRLSVTVVDRMMPAVSSPGLPPIGPQRTFQIMFTAQIHSEDWHFTELLSPTAIEPGRVRGGILGTMWNSMVQSFESERYSGPPEGRATHPARGPDAAFAADQNPEGYDER